MGEERRWSAFNASHGRRFIFHYTPKHASRVNERLTSLAVRALLI